MEDKLIVIKGKEYEIMKELGHGGFGKVFQVLGKSDNKSYAIKEIPIKEEKKGQIEEIQKEADILSKFNCDNIVKCYGTYENSKSIYILMEFCSEGNLRNFIDKNIDNEKIIKKKKYIQTKKKYYIKILYLNKRIRKKIFGMFIFKT